MCFVFKKVLCFLILIFFSLINKSIINESVKIREFGLYLTLACLMETNYLFEPYLNAILPNLLDMFNDKHRDVTNLNTIVLSKVFENISPYVANDILSFISFEIFFTRSLTVK